MIILGQKTYRAKAKMSFMKNSSKSKNWLQFTAMVAEVFTSHLNVFVVTTKKHRVTINEIWGDENNNSKKKLMTIRQVSWKCICIYINGNVYVKIILKMQCYWFNADSSCDKIYQKRYVLITSNYPRLG